MLEWLMIIFGVGPLALAFLGWAIGLVTGATKQGQSTSGVAGGLMPNNSEGKEPLKRTLYEHSCDPETGELGLKFNGRLVFYKRLKYPETDRAAFHLVMAFPHVFPHRTDVVLMPGVDPYLSIPSTFVEPAVFFKWPRTKRALFYGALFVGALALLGWARTL